MSNDERQGLPSDNAAILAGYTQEVVAESDEFTLCLLIKPDTEFDSRFRAWDMEEQEFIHVTGWMFTICAAETFFSNL